MSEARARIHEFNKKIPQALVLAVQPPEQSDADALNSIREMERLAGTLGITVVDTEVQKRRGASSSTFVGSGKLEELARRTAPEAAPEFPEEEQEQEQNPEQEPGGMVDLVLVDAELSPRQQRTLEVALGVEVLDRTAVILEIFETRARTREARLEVEIARLRYELPRQRDDRARDDSRGGGGRGARGATNVQLDKERIRDRIAQLSVELAEAQARAASRRARGSDGFQVVLVGYTNAGKSSIMRSLTESDVLAENKLFATLGTTVRQVVPPTKPPILLSDTVGFIRNLPHELVASFRSTLDEALDADHILLVVDASDPDFRNQLRVTRETLESIGAGGMAHTLVLNKIDRVGADAREALALEFPHATPMSALDPDDVSALHGALMAAQEEGLSEASLVVPFSRGGMLGEIHENARVLEESYSEEGTRVRMLAEAAHLDRWRGMLANGRSDEARPRRPM